MATDLETLVVRMEAQFRAFEREMARGRGVAERELKSIENRFKRANANVATSIISMGASLKAGLGALGIGFSVKGLQQFVDEFTKAQNALKVAELEGEELNRVYQSLFNSAQRNAAPLSAMVTLYSRVVQVQKELNVSSADVETFVDRIGTAIRVSGQSAEQSSGALLQLSQALGAGTVRAQEFRSMLDSALPIVQAAARGILQAAGSTAKLQQLVNDGKVSSEAFFRGVLAGSAELEKQAASMDLTIGQAFTKLWNALTDAVGQVDKTTGVSADAVKALGHLTDAIRDVRDAVNSAGLPPEKWSSLK